MKDRDILFSTARPSLKKASLQKSHTRYILRVQKLRKILPLIAGSVLILIFLWPQIMKILEKPSLSEYASLKGTLRGHNQIGSLRFQSTDAKGRPYYLNAKSALQKSTHTADLEIPHSKLQMKDGTMMEVTSDRGFYNDETKILNYQDHVKLHSETGYNLTTSLAHVNVEKKEAEGDCPVEGEGPAGRIQAEGFRLDQGGVLYFTGKSRLIIEKKKQAVSLEKKP